MNLYKRLVSMLSLGQCVTLPLEEHIKYRHSHYYQRNPFSRYLHMGEDYASLPFHQRGLDLKDHGFNSVGTAPALSVGRSVHGPSLVTTAYLWGEQLHTNGPTCSHIASIDDWFHYPDEGGRVGELVVKHNVQENVVHVFGHFQFLDVLHEGAVRVNPAGQETRRLSHSSARSCWHVQAPD